MKGYMEPGEFSRGKESIRADASIVLVGNFDVDVEHQQRIGHLFGPMPQEMRDDTAFMDRIHAYLQGWDVPKINKELNKTVSGLLKLLYPDSEGFIAEEDLEWCVRIAM